MNTVYLSQLSDHGPRNAQLGNALLLRVDGSWYEVMQLDFEVDNVINLVPTKTLHWQVEYRPPPAGGQSPPTTERATHLYIGNADIQGIVPLAENSLGSITSMCWLIWTHSPSSNTKASARKPNSVPENH
ncbi:unnamed protein product [Arctogadus glacialis]